MPLAAQSQKKPDDVLGCSGAREQQHTARQQSRHSQERLSTSCLVRGVDSESCRVLSCVVCGVVGHTGKRGNT
jgi:hypothetical protein